MQKKLFWQAIISIIGIEVLSFLSFQHPVIAPYVFGLVILAALTATIKNLEWGIYIVFAELVIGSFGKILVLPVNDFQLPIRMVLFGIVMAVWLVQVIRTRRVTFLRSQFFKPYLILAVALVWGLAWGLIRGHDFGAVFFDVNNYLYFLLIFPVYDVLVSGGNAINRVRTIMMAAVTWLSVKTVALFYIFSHELFALQDLFYAWSRKMQLAEITNINPAELTSRIFIQSQIWILFGLFVVLSYVYCCHSGAKHPKGHKLREAIESRNGSYRPSASRMTLILSTLFSSALVMSFSRSFWLAGLLSLLLLCAILLFILREKFIRVFSFGAVSAGIIAVAVLLTLGVAAFPIPRGTSSVDLLKNRASQFGDNAASSRLSQIRPLLTAIAQHPALGSGFGTSVTYQSQDPRIVKSHPDGWYTTTAFELGWLEMWLKIGLLGVGAYLYLLWKIFKSGWIKILSPYQGGDTEGVLCYDRYIILGGLMGLVALIITHGLSPYLNHPLGIGIVLLMTSLVNKDA